MTKAMIALSARMRRDPNTNRIFCNNESYYEFVRTGNGIASVVFASNELEAKEIAKRFDGLLITGGEDMDPSYYHEENIACEMTERDIDESDIYLYNAFKALNKPILGICRGIQVINVIEGGTLIQDIKNYDASKLNHQQYKHNPPKQMHDYAHSCNFIKDTILYNIYGQSHNINSFHHQAIKDLAKGFTTSGISEDGIIEAIEKDNIIAVQWHPERLLFDEASINLSKYFISLTKNSGNIL